MLAPLLPQIPGRGVMFQLLAVVCLTFGPSIRQPSIPHVHVYTTATSSRATCFRTCTSMRQPPLHVYKTRPHSSRLLAWGSFRHVYKTVDSWLVLCMPCFVCAFGRSWGHHVSSPTVYKTADLIGLYCLCPFLFAHSDGLGDITCRVRLSIWQRISID